MFRILIVLFLLVTGSGRVEDPGPLEVLLRYDAELAAKGFPNPVARLKFGDADAWFIFDTGAGVHALAHWFVEAADLSSGAFPSNSIEVVDATGQIVEVQNVGSLVGTTKDGSDLKVGTAIVADFPSIFEEAGVGGLLNPQLLAPDGMAATLDLRIPQFRIESFEAATRRLGAEAVSEDRVRFCATPATLIRSLLVALRTNSAEGEGWLEIDTGAEATSIRAGSPLVDMMTLGWGGQEMGVAGSLQRYYIARDVSMSFAGHQVDLDARVAQTAGGECGPDGHFGLDAMKACALVFSHDSLAVVCD